MRRLLLAVAVLLTAAASESLAGYLVIRVLLEGAGGAAPGGDPGAMPGPGGPSGPSGPSGLNPLGAPGRGGPSGPGPGLGGGPGGEYGPGMTGPAPGDPTRSVVVVIPFTAPPSGRAYNPKYAFHPDLNPNWPAVLAHKFGTTLLFTDNSTVQWYTELGQTPSTKTTRQTDLKARHAKWLKSQGDPQQLLELVSDALELGMVTDAVQYADELLKLSQDAKRASQFNNQVQKFAEVYAKLQPKLKGGAAPSSEAEIWRLRLDASNVHAQGHYTVIYWDSSADEVKRRADQLEDNLRAFFLWHALRGVGLEVPDRSLIAILPPAGEKVRPLAAGLDGLPMVADAFYAPEHDLVVLSPDRLDAVGQTFRRQVQSIYRDGVNRRDLLAGIGPKLDLTVPNRRADDAARMMTLAAVERYVQDEAEWAGVSREGSRQLFYATGLLPRHVWLPSWAQDGAANFFYRPKGPVFNIKEDGKGTMTVATETGYGGPNYVLQKLWKDLRARKELTDKPEDLLRNVLTDAYFAALKTGEELDPPPPPPLVTQRQQGGMLFGLGGPQGPAGPGPGAGPSGPSGPAPAGPGPGFRGLGPGAGYGGAPQMPGEGGMPGLAVPPEESASVLARKKRERMANKAQVTAWALYYYLARTNQPGLRRYFDELDRLPRDLPLDDKAALATFARAFDLTTADKPDGGKRTLKEFAEQWVQYINGLTPVGVDIPLHVPAPPSNPNQFGPGGPGFFPPSGPGGRPSGPGGSGS
jgi:hypothetical protein